MSPFAPESTDRPVLVDLILSEAPQWLSVAWPEVASGVREVGSAQIDQVRRQLDAVNDAERQRDKVLIPSSRRTLGRSLWDLLDGPDRRLTRAQQAAEDRGEPLRLVLRLRRGSESAGLVQHPAALWRWELLSPPSGGHPSADGRLRLAVQLGDVAPSGPVRALEHRGLRIVFMAYSPEGLQPVLDYEAEDDRINRALERPLREHRARVQVVEDGTLAELERRLRESEADVVHLTGHGIVTSAGPRLVMEDEEGRRDDVSPDQLLRVLRRAAKRPELVVISSCYSAEGRDGTPSFAAALVAGGMPAVLGWVQPVRDDVATLAAAELYGRLCNGDSPADAVAFVREQLLDADRSDPHPTFAWGTLHLLMRDARGFRVDRDGASPLPSVGTSGEALYKYLGATGGMKVLRQGFVGRRRLLQRLLRILRSGRDGDQRLVAGAVVLGMKGVGKSCLVGRALDRHAQDFGELGVVVLHGALDDIMVVQRFTELAMQRGDDVAERLLARDEPVPLRLRRLLTSHWADEPIVIVLDDFEQNLELRNDGDANLGPQAAALLEVLLPMCQAHRPKLLVTTTASFHKPSGHERALVELGLGPLEPPSVRKLWMRMPEAERGALPPDSWSELAERLGRNARVLDWARTLLQGKTPEDAAEMARRAGEEIPRWKDGGAPSEEQEAELARLFLLTMAIDEARERLHEDALTFVKRARVFERPVPNEALAGLVDGLAVELERDVVVLRNLGLLEVGELDGQLAHRVSPLVEPRFEVEDERWHAVAARYWERASDRQDVVDRFDRIMMAWRHALSGRCEDVAARAGRRINVSMHRRGLVRESRALAHEHLRAIPDSEAGLLWAGAAEVRSGNPVEGWKLYERGEKLATLRGASGADRARIIAEGAYVLGELGRLAEAEQRLLEAVELLDGGAIDDGIYAGVLNSLALVHRKMGKFAEARRSLETAIDVREKHNPSGSHADVAASLYSLGGVMLAQGDVEGARVALERSLAMHQQMGDSDETPAVATCLHALAGILRVQGDLAGARMCLERALDIDMVIYGTSAHFDVAASLHDLAMVLREQGELVGARDRLERSLEIKILVFETEVHPEVAASLSSLAGIMRVQGDFDGAREKLERAIAIKVQVHGTEVHPSVAASLHALAGVLLDQGDLAGARARLERSYEILTEVHGTDEHLDVATSLGGLAALLEAEGDAERAVASYRRALAIRARILGTKDHYFYVETEFALARVLGSMGMEDEARSMLVHVHAVLSAQVPNHPLMARLRQLLGEVATTDFTALANTALQCRRDRTPLPDALVAELEAVAMVGPPIDAVAAVVAAVASRAPLPAMPPDLPEELAPFVTRLLDLAQAVDAAGDSAEP